MKWHAREAPTRLGREACSSDERALKPMPAGARLHSGGAVEDRWAYWS